MVLRNYATLKNALFGSDNNIKNDCGRDSERTASDKDETYFEVSDVRSAVSTSGHSVHDGEEKKLLQRGSTFFRSNLTLSNNPNRPIKIAAPKKLAPAVIPKCAKCDKFVYAAEQLQAINRIWHKSCFSCGGTSSEITCKKVLNLTNYLSHGEDPFCRHCHQRCFGPKGFGYGISAMSTIQPDEERFNYVPPVYEPYQEEEVTAPEVVVPEVVEEEATRVEEVILPPPPPPPPVSRVMAILPKPRGSEFTIAPSCCYCDRLVYPREKLHAMRRIWHKQCFTCGCRGNAGGCGRPLNVENYLTNTGDPYCFSCHTDLFNPHHKSGNTIKLSDSTPINKKSKNSIFSY